MIGLSGRGDSVSISERRYITSLTGTKNIDIDNMTNGMTNLNYISYERFN